MPIRIIIAKLFLHVFLLRLHNKSLKMSLFLREMFSINDIELLIFTLGSLLRMDYGWAIVVIVLVRLKVRPYVHPYIHLFGMFLRFLVL